jgi:putative transcriptional regulator
MAIVRMTLEEVMATPSRRDRAKIDATTEADIRRHMIEDGEDPDAPLPKQDMIMPAFIRARLGMSQREFAATFGIPVATLRNWEQNRVAMDPATISLFRIIANEPKAAMRALRPKPARKAPAGKAAAD